MDTHENAPLTPKGRELMVRGVVEWGAVQGGGGAPVPHDAQDRRQMDRAVRGRGRRKACASAARGRFPRRAKRRLPHAKGSRLCAGSVTPASRSPLKSASRRRRSAASSGGWASTAVGAGAGRTGPRYERAAPARSSISTSKSSASSIGSATASPASGQVRATPEGSAGNMCIWRSTTTPDSPIRRSCPTRSAAPACVSCSTPCASFEASA